MKSVLVACGILCMSMVVSTGAMAENTGSGHKSSTSDGPKADPQAFRELNSDQTQQGEDLINKQSMQKQSSTNQPNNKQSLTSEEQKERQAVKEEYKTIDAEHVALEDSPGVGEKGTGQTQRSTDREQIGKQPNMSQVP